MEISKEQCVYQSLHHSITVTIIYIVKPNLLSWKVDHNQYIWEACVGKV